MKTSRFVGKVVLAVLVAVLGITLLPPVVAHASGFQFSELSATGVATGNALVADADDLGAIPYNPALMAYHPGHELLAGLVLVDAHEAVRPATGGERSGQASMPRFSPNGDYFVTGPHASAGIGIDTPYGFITDWPANTFFTGGAAQPLATKLTVYDLHPMVAARWRGFALGAEIDYYNVRELLLTSPGAQLAGGGDQAGYSLGLAYRASGWTLGARYRSAANVRVDGDINGTPATGVLPLPWSFQAGLSRALSSRATLEADFQRTGWNRLQQLVVTGPGGAALSTSTFGWTATNAYRVAGSYRLPGGVTVHAGFAYEQNPAPDARFSARLPVGQERLFSLGASQKMGPWSLDAGLGYAVIPDRLVASTVAPGTYGSDLNGTSAYNGRYRTRAYLLGVGLTRHFGEGD